MTWDLPGPMSIVKAMDHAIGIARTRFTGSTPLDTQRRRLTLLARHQMAQRVSPAMPRQIRLEGAAAEIGLGARVIAAPRLIDGPQATSACALAHASGENRGFHPPPGKPAYATPWPNAA